jgi:hypothetical protein
MWFFYTEQVILTPEQYITAIGTYQAWVGMTAMGRERAVVVRNLVRQQLAVYTGRSG